VIQLHTLSLITTEAASGIDSGIEKSSVTHIVDAAHSCSAQATHVIAFPLSHALHNSCVFRTQTTDRRMLSLTQTSLLSLTPLKNTQPDSKMSQLD
jgi:hypothetical protein